MVKQGYMGLATINGEKIRCTDFSMNPIQDALFYDPIFGLRDSRPTTIYGGKSDVGNANPQKFLWRAGVKSYAGSINYPVCDTEPLIKLAQTGDDFDLELKYSCGLTRKFDRCKINSYTLSVTAGDIVTVSANIMALNASDTLTDEEHYKTSRKLLTWDDVYLSFGFDVHDFSITINNSCRPIYTAYGLSPIQLRLGVQMVTGAITYYSDSVNIEYLKNVRNLDFKSSIVDLSYYVLFKPSEINGVVGPLLTTQQFVAVDINN
jgi:hypothetical protein